MSLPSDNPSSGRWYDQDPALYSGLESLRSAPSKQQAQVALNIIKIIVEHRIESETFTDVETLVNTLEQSRLAPVNARRWYDVNETLRSAIQLLQDCPDDLQQTVVPSICRMIEASLNTFNP